ncbi:hypothetical protein Tco_1295680, partial [Tanacetum coccineum]
DYKGWFGNSEIVDENNPTLSSTSLVNSSSLKMKYFTDLEGSDAICYQMSGRFLSLMIEHLLGEDYKNDELTSFRPHNISAASFKKPLASKVALTSHMLKVSKLLPNTEETLILSSERVNVDDTVD